MPGWPTNATMQQRRQWRELSRTLSLILAYILLASSLSASELLRHSVRCDQRPMEYLVFVPKGAPSGPLPALLLLHGAGDRAENFIQAWEPLAQENTIVLIAPQLPREEAFEAQAPQVFRCIVENVRKEVNLDSHRIYLFGHSMGGYLAYDGALLDSNLYAAAAIHAMGIADDYTWIVPRAARKIPIAI